MKPKRYFLLKGIERFIDHPKSIALFGKLFWKKSNKKMNVGDVIYLFMSGKGHCQIRYKLEVTNTSVERIDQACWHAPFVADNDCFEFTPIAPMYQGSALGYDALEDLNISRYVQYCALTKEQVDFIDQFFQGPQDKV